MSQTTVDMQDTLPVLPGTLHGMGPHRTHSYVSEEASAEIPFGVMVAQGSADDGAKKVDGTDKPVGIVVRHHGFAQESSDLGTTGIKPKTMMTVLTHGQIYVRTEDAVDPTDPVRVRTTAAGEEVLGAFRTAADDNDCALLTGARWMSSAGAGEIAILEIDMTEATMTEEELLS